MITLSSDFGTPYPAAMKGVILERAGPDTQLVDVSHDFPRGDVQSAAFWLREVLPFFPPAVHLVVVDPGVGTDRDAIVIRVDDHALVGPDNGVLIPAAEALIEERPPEHGPALEVFVIDDTDAASATFHGRDVFAPAAADVHEAGVGALETLQSLTPREEYVDLEFLEARVTDERAVGTVLVVDDFGNVITNVPGSVLNGRETVRANGEEVPVGETFATVPAGERLATVGSHGFVELDVNDGRGDDAFGLTTGDEVVLCLE